MLGKRCKVLVHVINLFFVSQLCFFNNPSFLLQGRLEWDAKKVCKERTGGKGGK